MTPHLSGKLLASIRGSDPSGEQKRPVGALLHRKRSAAVVATGQEERARNAEIR